MLQKENVSLDKFLCLEPSPRPLNFDSRHGFLEGSIAFEGEVLIFVT